MGANPRGMHPDHINRNKLDNRRENLRFVTFSQNQYNRASRNRGYDERYGRFRARIQINGKVEYIGTYDTAEEATAAYQARRDELLLARTD